MPLKLIALLLATVGSFSAQAGNPTTPTLKCDPPVIQVPADPAAGQAQYVITCGAQGGALLPALTFAGAVDTHGAPPYDVRATYVINVQGSHAKKLREVSRVDQMATGELTTSTVSLAALPSQFAAQSVWDASSGALSIEEAAGKWRVFSVSYAEVGKLRVFSAEFADVADEPSVVEAGVASTPVRNGRATAKVTLGSKYSRFAGKTGSTLPVVIGELALRDGKLELQVGETRVANQPALQGALLQLDRQPKDIARAWALAARAKFLGLDDEIRYAEQKVAAHHPDLLEEFQLAIGRIKPHSAAQ